MKAVKAPKPAPAVRMPATNEQLIQAIDGLRFALDDFAHVTQVTLEHLRSELAERGGLAWRGVK